MKRACFKAPLLALLTATAFLDVIFAWEPSNLTARVSPESDGFNSIEVTWNPGACSSWDWSTVSIIRGDDVRNRTVKTARGLVTFGGSEWWSRIEIVFQAGLLCGREELHKFIESGPGPPHKPKEFRVTSDATSANFTIVESFMPRAISGYVLQLCKASINGRAECKTQPFIKHAAIDGLQKGTITDLAPESTYEFSLAPIILDEEKTYNGEALTGSFSTSRSEYPRVLGATASFEEELDSSLTGAFTWTVADSVFVVDYFWVWVEPCETECSLQVHRPEANFTGLRFAHSTTLKVSTHFTVDGKQNRTENAFKLKTPEYVPTIKTLPVAKMSPTEVIFEWVATSVPSLYDVLICHNGSCVPQRTDGSRIHLRDREPGGLYSVDIHARQENFTVHLYSGTIKMLTEDYETPAIKSIHPIEESWNKVDYGVDVTITSKPSAFEVSACDSGRISGACHRQQVEKIGDARLPLSYFKPYDVQIVAVYKLDLNMEARRSVSGKLDTIGTTPEPVTGILFAYVSSNSTEIRWSRSRNVPRPMGKRLEISYEISTGSKPWTTTKNFLRITDLLPYTEYNFTVRAIVTYLNSTLIGEAAAKPIKTDAGTPGKVGSLVIKQRIDSAEVSVEWEAPAAANGPLNFYYVEFRSLTPNPVTTKIPVNGTRTEIRLPVHQEDTPYEFAVTAVNLAVNGREILGERAGTNVTISGMGLTFNVWVIGRTENSLQLSFNFSVDPKRGLSQPFFTVTDSKNRTTSTKTRLVTVRGLGNFQNETMRIRGCFSADYCSEEVVLTALTDVGVPSKVIGLHVEVINKTNLLIRWEEPVTKNGPINGYLVEIIDKTDLSVKRNFTRKGDTNLFFPTADEFETYKITVRAFNERVDEEEDLVYGPADTVEKRTSGFSVPKPENLTIVGGNSTAVNIEYQVAADLHGYKVTSYTIEIMEPKLQGIRTQELSAIIPGFEPFQKFRIGVRSCIGSPAEPSCGLPRMIEGRTDSAAPSEPRNLTVEILDDHTGIVSWKAPAQSNGEIAGYALTIKSSTTQSWKYLGNSTLSYKAGDLKPSETYKCSVVAHTFDNDRKRLDSEAATIQFSTALPSSIWPWVLLFLFVAVIAASIGGFVYLRRRRDQRYGRMAADQVDD